MGKLQATSPFWLRLCKSGTGEDPCKWSQLTWNITWYRNTLKPPSWSLSTAANSRDLALPRHPYATRTDTCTTRLIISHPNILFPSRPATITLVWVLKVFPDVHTGLGQFGKPFSFNLNTLVTLVHDKGQPLTRYAKIKEQFEKMENEGKTCWQYKPTSWCSDMTIREARKYLESV